MAEAYAREGVMVNSGPFDGERTPATIETVAEWLAQEGRGKPAVTFRLRDWLISRAALLGRADPDRALPDVRRGPRSRGGPAGPAAR